MTHAEDKEIAWGKLVEDAIGDMDFRDGELWDL